MSRCRIRCSHLPLDHDHEFLMRPRPVRRRDQARPDWRRGEEEDEKEKACDVGHEGLVKLPLPHPHSRR